MVSIFLLLIIEFKINSYSKKKNFLIIGSAHNLKEIKTKEKQGIETYIYISIV